MSSKFNYSDRFCWWFFAVGCIVLVYCVYYTVTRDHATPPTPQKTKLSPLCNNGSQQYHSKCSPLSSRELPTIPQRCTVVVVIPKCTVVVNGELKTSPLSKVVEKNIKKDVILERGGRTDIFDLEVFE